ncbi:PREDICTED: zinc finger CCCH domain-containing protein 59-like [Camelina sativa]|uniref:Zinc finger CCCH domain-containing protein 59-like n=1 Tax=Camelina sativa TaxID=90675 RepID=A0ABM1RNQ3_CAMSA|nr:PREDICTED: zinc finger CCCH domain-containing protein 59-like [Camelina sativa]
MNHKAPRKGRNFGVVRQQDFAVDIVPRSPSVPYDKRVRKGPYNGSRNLVWTSKEFQTSQGNRPRKNGPYGSMNSPVSSTEYRVSNQPRKNDAYKPMNSPVSSSGYRVSNQPRKNEAYKPMISPVSGTGYRVSDQPRNNGFYGSRSSTISGSRVWTSEDNGSPKSRESVCKYWKAGNCKKSEQCEFLHSWCCFPGLVMVATLEGHKKDIKGIALPQGSDKLYSFSGDGVLRIWDCHTGQSVHEINLQAEAGSLISEGPWVFLGLPNAVKAFNVQTREDLHLNGSVGGQVNAMAVGHGMLCAGTSSGSISVWKVTDTESDPFKYLTSLEGHSGEVKCFVVGGQRLYSGSVDKTIKVWDLDTLQCVMTLRQHSNTVTSLLCWDQYLLSSSLDGTIKVWGSSESPNLKVIHTRSQEQSVHALCGLHDAEARPIIFCSYQNGTVGIYDLPSFEERGKMFSTHTMGTLTIGPEGLLFSGDMGGKVRVWSLGGSKE